MDGFARALWLASKNKWISLRTPVSAVEPVAVKFRFCTDLRMAWSACGSWRRVAVVPSSSSVAHRGHMKTFSA